LTVIHFPKAVSASAATAADDSPDYWQCLKEAEDRFSEPAMSSDHLPSGGGMEEEDRQMYAEPDHEEADTGVAEFQQGRPSLLLFKVKILAGTSQSHAWSAECCNFDVTGHKEEENQPDASKYEGAYARHSVGKTIQDYVHAAWELSESSEEDVEDNVPATADVEHEAEDEQFQVSRQSSWWAVQTAFVRQNGDKCLQILIEWQ